MSNNNEIERIIIRHISGSKANQVEQIPFEGLTEITIGRDPSSKIMFDSPRDDIASRRHAVIRVMRGDKNSFRIADLGSSNGTFLNGERITEEKELLPEDSIELGKNGLKFVFDVQPRPPYLVSRTRTIAVNDPAATRLVKAAEVAVAVTSIQEADGNGDIKVDSSIQKFEPPLKPGVGKETVMRLLGEERRATSRVWISSLAGVAAVVALAGGAFYWKHQRDLKNEEALLVSKIDQNADVIEEKNQEEQRRQAEARGLSSQEVVTLFGNATAQINRSWRLYDKATGDPVFQLTFGGVVGEGGHRQIKIFPAYVRLAGNGPIVRWLTLEHDNRSNIEIGGSGSGTGFVVDEQGFMLTNKHVAAPWNLSFGQADPANGYGYGWLFEEADYFDTKKKHHKPPTLIDLTNDQNAFLRGWVPASGGVVFDRNVPIPIGGNIPDPSKNTERTFFGRNDSLEVRFANSRGKASATLVRFSDESDAALIKVDTPQKLKALNIANDDTIGTGEPVIAIGFPGVAEPILAVSTTIENGQRRDINDIIPVPFVTEGIVSLISPAVRTVNEVTFGGARGDVFQMSINSTGAGNSGGPVFNKKGQVIGIFTYTSSLGGANTTEAIPIKYGRNLLLSQAP
ncbi:MAG: trypsin-like peptidase domain-containing protein [Alphaproteobacteria bacterium]|nr:trypsin-like peptidase domain-containing protein [Alphaproteobacteria bacterium]